MNKSLRKHKVIIYFYSLLALFCLLALIWLLRGSFLRVTVTPKDSILMIDNAPMKLTSAGKITKRLKAGKHQIRVEKENFISFNEEITLRVGSIKNIQINIKEAPKPLSTGGLLAKGNELSDSFYLGDNGKTIYKAVIGFETDGAIKNIENQAITAPKLSGVDEIIWSPDKNLALFRKSTGLYLFDFKKYDFVNQAEAFFGTNIGSIAWAPDNSKLAYFYSTSGPNGEKTLMFSNLANTQIERVYNFLDTSIENPLLHWSSDSKKLLIISRSRKFDQNKIYSFDPYSRLLSELTDTGNQVDAVFSPDNSKIIYATYSTDPNEPIPFVLSIMNADGTDKKSLDVRADIRKGVFFKDSKNLLLVSYNTQAAQDYMFKFNIETKQKSFAVNNSGGGRISSIALVNEDQIILYESNNSLYGIKSNIFN